MNNEEVIWHVILKLANRLKVKLPRGEDGQANKQGQSEREDCYGGVEVEQEGK